MQDKTDSNNLLKQLVSDDFFNYCTNKVIPLLEPVEKIRVEKLRKIKLFKKLLDYFLIAAIIFVAIAFILVVISGNDGKTPLGKLSIVLSQSSFLCILVCSLLNLRLNAIINPIINDMKSRVYSILMSYFGTFSYSNKQIDTGYGVYSSIGNKLKKLKIFKRFNICNCDDYITGEYNGLSLVIADVKLIYESEYGSKKTSNTVFDGVIIETDCKKKFDSCTVVRIDEGAAGNFLQVSELKLESIKLEDTVFFKEKFEVFSNDQIEARYLLTTAFMERLLKLQKRLKMPVTCSFENEKLYIALHNEKNWFDIDLENDSLIDIRTYQKILIEIVSVLSVLDILKAENDTGM